MVSLGHAVSHLLSMVENLHQTLSGISKACRSFITTKFQMESHVLTTTKKHQFNL